MAHVLALGASIFVLHEVAPLTFQQSLILLVPVYALLWAALCGVFGTAQDPPGKPRGAVGGIAEAARLTWQRLSDVAGEVGVFAAAGFLPVVLLTLIPLDGLQILVADLGLTARPLALAISVGVVALALGGVNPIVSASVLGAIAAQLDVPGLSDVAIALALTGGWTAVMGLSPFITTIVICAASIGRPVMRIGPVWNGPYSLAIVLIWAGFLWAAIGAGLL